MVILLSKLVKKLIETIPSPDLNLKKNYKLARKVVDLVHTPFLKPENRIWDYEIVGIPVRLFLPKKDGIHPLIIYIHGGGWTTGNVDSYTKVCTHLADFTNHIVLSINYRLAPEYPFPTGLMDCYQVVQTILNHPETFQITKEQIALMGDSAGGNLVAAISLMSRDRKAIIPTKQVLIYPVTYPYHNELSPFPSVIEQKDNITLSAAQVNDYIELYQGKKTDRSNPYFAPLLAKNFKNQPRTLILTGELDILRDEGEYYGMMLKKGKNKVEIIRIPEVGHGFINYSPKLPTIKKVYQTIDRFLKEKENDK